MVTMVAIKAMLIMAILQNQISLSMSHRASGRIRLRGLSRDVSAGVNH